MNLLLPLGTLIFATGFYNPKPKRYRKPPAKGVRSGRRLGEKRVAKILLVEDNEMNSDMLSRRLTRKGFDVVVAVDGIEGLSLAASDQPDLILMDMSLPGMDGWEATRQVKAAPETNHIPIIALTAHAMSDDREKALEAGCDDYDTKPVELERLLRKIGRLLKSNAE